MPHVAVGITYHVVAKEQFVYEQDCFLFKPDHPGTGQTDTLLALVTLTLTR